MANAAVFYFRVVGHMTGCTFTPYFNVSSERYWQSGVSGIGEVLGGNIIYMCSIVNPKLTNQQVPPDDVTTVNIWIHQCNDIGPIGLLLCV